MGTPFLGCNSLALVQDLGRKCTFREGAGVAVHLQGVQGADLQLGMVVQELLHDGLEGQQQLFLLLELLFGGGRQLLVALRHAQLLGDELEETGRRSEDSGPLRKRLSHMKSSDLLLASLFYTTFILMLRC